MVGHQGNIGYDLEAQQPPISDFPKVVARKPIHRSASERAMAGTDKEGVIFRSHLESLRRHQRCAILALSSVVLLTLVLIIIVIACQ